MRSQLVVANWFKAHGFPWAESTGAGRSGVDITGMVGLSPEVKARTELQPQSWLRQADRESGLPFVVFRLNGVGEANVGSWGVMMRLDRFTELLHDAGYGDPSEVTEDGNDQSDSGDRQESDGGEAEHKAHPSGDAFVHAETHGTESTPA